MRSLFAFAAAAWFVFQAVAIGDGSSGLLGDAPNQQVVGDPVVMTIHLVARVLFVGVALLALAAVDWAALRRMFR